MAIAVVAPCVAFLTSRAAVRAALPVGLLQVIFTAAMWTPIILLTLFLVMQLLPGGREPVPWGCDIRDTWFVTLVLCTFVVDFRNSLGPETRWPIVRSTRSAALLEVVLVGLMLVRLFQTRGKIRRVRPSLPG
jgi:hypothetical protein